MNVVFTNSNERMLLTRPLNIRVNDGNEKIMRDVVAKCEMRGLGSDGSGGLMLASTSLTVDLNCRQSKPSFKSESIASSLFPPNGIV